MVAYDLFGVLDKETHQNKWNLQTMKWHTEENGYFWVLLIISFFQWKMPMDWSQYLKPANSVTNFSNNMQLISGN